MRVRKTQLLARQHRGMTMLLGVGFLVHLAAWIAYWPALWYSDSVSYADLAVHGGMSPTRQMAYPWIMRALIFVGGQTSGVLAFLTATQHLAALVVGALIYAMLRKFEVVTWLAVLGAAIFVLDAFSLSVEQTILSEGYYVLALTASFALIVLRRGDARALFFSGLLLAGAVWLRSAALFAIPAWVIYLFFTTRAWRPRLLGIVAVAAPLLIYMTLYWQVTGVFGFTQTKGWFMYGRVAEIANCKTMDVPARLHRLCPKQPAHAGAAWYIWDWHSPAWRMYGRNPGGDPDYLERFDSRLGSFARAVIRDRPGAYAGLVASDFYRFFEPGLMKRGDNDDLTTTFGRYNAPKTLHLPSVRNPQRTFDGYRTPKRFPASVVNAYSHVVHLPRAPLGLLLLASLLGVAVPRLRRHVRHAGEVALMSGAAFCVLLGHAMTSDFAVRYLIPVVPLILAGGIPGCRWVWVATAGRRPRAVGASPQNRAGDPASREQAHGDDLGSCPPREAPARRPDTAVSAP